MSRILHRFIVHPSVIEKFLDVLQDGQSAILTYSAEEDNYVVELREGTSDETVIQTVGVKFVVNGCVSHSSKWATLEETYLERIRSLQAKIDDRDEEIRSLKLDAAGQSNLDFQKEEAIISHWQTTLGNTADSLRDACQVILNFQHNIKSLDSLRRTLEERIKHTRLQERKAMAETELYLDQLIHITKRSCGLSSKWRPHTEPPDSKKLVRLRFGDNSDCDGFYDSECGNYYKGKPGFNQHTPVHPTYWSEINGAENNA